MRPLLVPAPRVVHERGLRIAYRLPESWESQAWGGESSFGQRCSRRPRSALHAMASVATRLSPCSASRRTIEPMPIQRMDHVGIVVDDLAAATEFFVELGLELQGEASVEGPWVDRVDHHLSLLRLSPLCPLLSHLSASLRCRVGEGQEMKRGGVPSAVLRTLGPAQRL